MKTQTLSMKTLASTLTAFLLISACAKSGGPKNGGENGGADPVAMGTVSGGGGNGLDNKAIESYTIRIDELPEFKRYIVPVMRRISRGRGDVISAYMNYVIQNKPWYLIPRDLEDVPKERVGLGFKTEQLALHSEGGVYLHKVSYLKKNQKERAELLMHEIVMGVRLLMKKSPTEQCEKLAGNDLKACSDSEMMALAQSQDFDAKEQVIMSEVDHDAVRALTIFLMQRTEEVTAQAVSVKRRQLKFLFPWDQAVSTLTPEEVILIMRRANLADRVFRSAVPVITGTDTKLDIRCRWNDNPFDAIGIFLVLSSPAAIAKPDAPNMGSQYFPEAYTKNAHQYANLNWAGQSTTHVAYETASVYTDGAGFSAKGILDPNDSKRVIDLVTIRPDVNETYFENAYGQNQIELLITREKNPKLLEIRSRPVKLLLKTPGGIKSKKDYEIIAQEKYAIHCKLDQSAN